MAAQLASDAPCSNHGSEAALGSWPSSVGRLCWAQGAHQAFLREQLFLPGAELMGRAAAGATHQPDVLPFLGAGPEARGRASGFHCVAVSNSFGI